MRLAKDVLQCLKIVNELMLRDDENQETDYLKFSTAKAFTPSKSIIYNDVSTFCNSIHISLYYIVLKFTFAL